MCVCQVLSAKEKISSKGKISEKHIYFILNFCKLTENLLAERKLMARKTQLNVTGKKIQPRSITTNNKWKM